MFIEIILLLFAILIAFEYFIRYGRIGKYVNQIPGPPVWPIFGCLPDIIFPRFPTSEKIFKIQRQYDIKYYPIYKFWSAHRVGINILHPDDIEKLLTSSKHTSKSILYLILKSWLGEGLLVSSGSKWQRRRKMLTHAFHFNVLKEYFKNIVENGEKTMEILINQGESIHEVNELVSDYTLKVICETAMGVKLSDKGFIKKYRQAIHCVGECGLHRIYHPWLISDFVFSLTNKSKKYKEALKILHGFTRKIIKERKEFHERTNGRFLTDFTVAESASSNTNENDCGYRKNRLAMLDLLIVAQRNGEQIDDQGIQEEVDTFTFEGHDTTAVVLTYAILLIAEHKDVQDRIRTEVSDILDCTRSRLGMSEIQRFSYLEMCMKECLRLYPSVQHMSRSIDEDLQLTNYLIPKGTLVYIHPYSVHRVPEFWPNPEKFDPERFSPENSIGRHPFSYIPFSAGARNCIGQKFAMLELKSFIAHLVYNFILEPITSTGQLSFIPDMVLRSARPVYVKLIPIKK